ncbi:MAG: hypothetical protein IJW05_12445 [Lentisphaeria bacterium]|nr:hypothetical protein [Lentisphaeria bacterium]
MIKRLIADDTNYEGVDSSGKKSATRYLIYECDPGDSTMILAESNYIPQRGDAHPDYPAWTVQSIDPPVYDSSEPRFMIRVKYGYGGSSGGGAGSGNNNAKPWELGPQNITFGVGEMEYQIQKLWNPQQKDWIPLVNGAGNRIIKMGRSKYLKLSFEMNYKHRIGEWVDVSNTGVSINSEKQRICNIVVGAYCGKMQPVIPIFHRVFENDGKTVKWEYETVKFEIDIVSGGNTWMEKCLNVGRLARFLRNGELSEPEVIFSYTPWKYKDDSDNLKKVKATYGGMEEVLAANSVYQNAVGDKTKKIPYSQVDEELPLKTDGTVYLAAMRNPADNPYLTIDGLEVVPESWAKYSLPERI